MRGAYHFFVPADDPESQARWFLSQIALEPGDLHPVVDIETLGADPPHDLAGRLRRFLELVEADTGVPIDLNRAASDMPLERLRIGAPR